MHLLRNLFLTLLYDQKKKKKCKVFANRNQKTVVAHFFWRTQLVSQRQLLPQEEALSLQRALSLAAVCARVKTATLVGHGGARAAASAGGGTRSADLGPPRLGGFPAVAVQHTRGRGAHLTGTACVTNYGELKHTASKAAAVYCSGRNLCFSSTGLGRTRSMPPVSTWCPSFPDFPFGSVLSRMGHCPPAIETVWTKPFSSTTSNSLF